MPAKRSIVEWWTGTLANNVLTPKRGCLRKVIEMKTLDEKSTNEPQRAMTANIGDRLMLFGPSIDQIATAEVRSIKVEGYASRLFVSVGCGAVNDGPVHILKIKAAS